MQNIYKRLKGLLFFVCLGFFWQGCNIVNPTEPIPTYIHIDSFKFTENKLWPNLPATSSITNVWVFYNNNPVGAFDLPATVPIIASGTGTVTVFPGVIIDGQNTLTGVYPFYTADTFSLVAQPGKTFIHEPTTEYYNDIKEPWHANFIGSDFVMVGGNIPIISVKDDSLVYASTYSGSILLTHPGDSSIDSSYQSFAIPSGIDAYIEFDYKSSVPFYVGLSANLSTISSTPYYLTGIYPSATTANNGWQKFYLSVVAFNSQYMGSSYNFYIKASLPAGQPYGRVLIENLQLITF